MSETPQAARMFKYVKPDMDKSKKVVVLARTDHMFAGVQVVKKGGENNLHSHPNMDGLWMVLTGRVRFYTTDDAVLGEFGPLEGVLIPHDYPYWFESVGEEELQLLQFEAFTKSVQQGDKSQRVNHRPLRETLNPETVEILDAQAPGALANGL